MYRILCCTLCTEYWHFMDSDVALLTEQACGGVWQV